MASFFGDTLDRDRQDIIDRFQDRTSDLRFFVGNPKTGGYGLTLTASHTVISPKSEAWNVLAFRVP